MKKTKRPPRNETLCLRCGHLMYQHNRVVGCTKCVKPPFCSNF